MNRPDASPLSVSMLPLLLVLLSTACGPVITTGVKRSGPPPAPETPSCEQLVFDLNAGTLGGLAPTVDQPEAKTRFPCATGATEDGSAFNYGGGVFFLDHDFYMYTGKDFIEARKRFPGKILPNVLEMSPRDIVAEFGQPTQVDDIPGAYLYDRPYGCLRIEPGLKRHHEVAVHYESCESVASWYRH